MLNTKENAKPHVHVWTMKELAEHDEAMSESLRYFSRVVQQF
jgi:hypothetical protein